MIFCILYFPPPFCCTKGRGEVRSAAANVRGGAIVFKKTVRAFFVADYRSGNAADSSDKASLWHTRGTV